MLTTFMRCQRQFQLRYVDRLSWPEIDLDEEVEKSRQRGEDYHEVIQRVLLGVAQEPAAVGNPMLKIYLDRFLAWSEHLPDGKQFVEFELMVPVDAHYLGGRLDLFIVGKERVHIYDWKSAVNPPEIETLWQHMQTRLYLALVSEGSEATGRAVGPDQVSLTYWYPHDPPTEIRLVYSEKKHAENWGILKDIAAGIDWLLNQESPWPKTTDLDVCRRCPYQIICGRQVGSIDLSGWEPVLDEDTIEPDWL